MLSVIKLGLIRLNVFIASQPEYKYINIKYSYKYKYKCYLI